MGNFNYRTSQGFQTSVADENILTTLRPDATAPSLKTFSMYVDGDASIIINDDDSNPVYVTAKLGLNYADVFQPVKSIKFKTSGVNYFIAYGV